MYLGLGGNLPTAFGDPAQTIAAAIARLSHQPGISVTARSRIYRSAAWPQGGQPDYANAVVCVRTVLLPMALLRVTQSIERAFGRVRRQHWGPRQLDIDILDFGGLVTDEAVLTLPHPWMEERAFVLEPLAEIGPGWRHPLSGEGAASTLAALGEPCLAVWDGPVNTGATAGPDPSTGKVAT